MDWGRAFRENWRYKLAALALASLLWINVTANERDDQRVPTRLELDVRDTAWVLVEAPPEVQTTFEGRTRDLLALRVSDPVLRVAVDSVSGPTMRVSLTSGMVVYDRNLNVRPTGVSPGSVDVRFEARRRRRVPVRPDIEVGAAAGYAVVRPFVVQPDSVTVSGAAADVNPIRHVETRPVTLSGLEHTVTQELPVQPPAGLDAGSLSPSSVLVTVEVDSLVERSVTLPVTARGPAASEVAVDADSVRITLRGAWRIVREALEGPPSAYVSVEERPQRAMDLPVSVELPRAASISATIRPGKVTVRPVGDREGQAGGAGERG